LLLSLFETSFAKPTPERRSIWFANLDGGAQFVGVNPAFSDDASKKGLALSIGLNYSVPIGSTWRLEPGLSLFYSSLNGTVEGANAGALNLKTYTGLVELSLYKGLGYNFLLGPVLGAFFGQGTSFDTNPDAGSLFSPRALYGVRVEYQAVLLSNLMRFGFQVLDAAKFSGPSNLLVGLRYELSLPPRWPQTASTLPVQTAAKEPAPTVSAKPSSPPVQIVLSPLPIYTPTPMKTSIPDIPRGEVAKLIAPAVIEVTLPVSRVFFDTASSEITQGSGAYLRAFAKLIKASATQFKGIMIQGHTDSRGTAELNQRLSLERANSVQAIFTTEGVDSSRVHTEGKGSTMPLSLGNDEQAWKMNRRVEIQLQGVETGNSPALIKKINQLDIDLK
jgi:outer membrane protein OmpA-like peptidoglycan-associated protein